ncbi:MAG: class I SAM-dependent methyltransferase [Lentisphaeria bacterium]|nr:class I SAM-dependent methyltransferase [Lentisphaeria bacterium]
MTARLTLLPGREKSLLRRHPWIFSGAVKDLSGSPEAGDTVEVADSSGHVLALAAWSPRSQIAGRVWTFDPGAAVDAAFFRERVGRAAALREELGLLSPDGGCRLIYSESDGLPGVIADLYCGIVVLQLLSAGAEAHRAEIVGALMALPCVRGICERSDVSIRRREGLPPASGQLAGDAEETIKITENGLVFEVDLLHGQKTGFYFDLRDARRRLRDFAPGRKVLNMFSYTGAFAVNALASGAEHVINCDSSRPALLQAEKNVALNNLDGSRVENICGDGFDLLRKLRQEKRKFDLIVLDPPKLVDSRNALDRGCRAYQFLAESGFELLAAGGVMFSFSCSGLMVPELFHKITASAAAAVKCDAKILSLLLQAPDHPVDLATPETLYLKGFISRKNK